MEIIIEPKFIIMNCSPCDCIVDVDDGCSDLCDVYSYED